MSNISQKVVSKTFELFFDKICLMGLEERPPKGSWKKPREKVERRIIINLGKGPSVDMSFDPDSVVEPVNPIRALEEIRQLVMYRKTDGGRKNDKK